MHLADDLIGVFLPESHAGQDLAPGHGDLGGIDAVGTVHRAAAAFGALVVIAVPVLQYVQREVGGAD